MIVEDKTPTARQSVLFKHEKRKGKFRQYENII